MRIAIRAGHSLDVRGARGIIDEVDENRKITAKVVEYLKGLGHEVLDVTPTKSRLSFLDLSIPVSKANKWGADVFASIHLNAGGGHGSEVLYVSTKGSQYATKVVNKLSSLGFTNRGAKRDVRGLYEFKKVKCPNIIVEVCFVDSADDCILYKKLGVNAIAKAIAEGITGQTVSEVPYFKGLLKLGSRGEEVRKLQVGLLNKGFNCGEIDGDFGPATLRAVKIFQAANGLKDDGLVGILTWTKLFS